MYNNYIDGIYVVVEMNRQRGINYYNEVNEHGKI